jgi:hypothetical protein
MTLTDSFEQELKKYFVQKDTNFSDGSSSYDELDFVILDRDNQPAFHLDVKEKRQTYNLANWPKFAPEPDLFILDDLAVRKCLAYAPKSGILIRDNLRKKYFFFSIIDLALMPRVRVNRSIHRNQLDLKGKWLINLHNGKEGQSLDEAISHIRNYLRNMKAYLFERHECYGVYVNENIERGGITRRPSHWDTDVQGTR